MTDRKPRSAGGRPRSTDPSRFKNVEQPFRELSIGLAELISRAKLTDAAIKGEVRPLRLQASGITALLQRKHGLNPAVAQDVIDVCARTLGDDDALVRSCLAHLAAINGPAAEVRASDLPETDRDDEVGYVIQLLGEGREGAAAKWLLDHPEHAVSILDAAARVDLFGAARLIRASPVGSDGGDPYVSDISAHNARTATRLTHALASLPYRSPTKDDPKEIPPEPASPWLNTAQRWISFVQQGRSADLVPELLALDLSETSISHEADSPSRRRAGRRTRMGDPYREVVEVLKVVTQADSGSSLAARILDASAASGNAEASGRILLKMLSSAEPSTAHALATSLSATTLDSIGTALVDPRKTDADKLSNPLPTWTNSDDLAVLQEFLSARQQLRLLRAWHQRLGHIPIAWAPSSEHMALTLPKLFREDFDQVCEYLTIFLDNGRSRSAEDSHELDTVVADAVILLVRDSPSFGRAILDAFIAIAPQEAARTLQAAESTPLHPRGEGLTILGRLLSRELLSDRISYEQILALSATESGLPYGLINTMRSADNNLGVFLTKHLALHFNQWGNDDNRAATRAVHNLLATEHKDFATALIGELDSLEPNSQWAIALDLARQGMIANTVAKLPVEMFSTLNPDAHHALDKPSKENVLPGPTNGA